MKKRIPTEKEIAQKHSISLDYVTRQAEIGSTIEREHVTTHEEAYGIALQHIMEFPDYYKHLLPMEKKLKSEWNKKKTVKENHIAVAMGREIDDEGSMAKSQLETMEKALKILKKAIKNDDMQMPGWVQSKITLATDYIDTVADYMSGVDEEFANYYEEHCGCEEPKETKKVLSKDCVKTKSGTYCPVHGMKECPSYKEDMKERADFWHPDPEQDRKLGGPGANQRAREDREAASKPKEDPKKLRPGESYMDYAKRHGYKSPTPKKKGLLGKLLNREHLEVTIDEATLSFTIDKKKTTGLSSMTKADAERHSPDAAARHKKEREKVGLPSIKNEGAAWTRKEGQNKNGGLNEKGRKSYERENPGSDLKAPQPEGGSRRDSFCARMRGMKNKRTSKKTANDPNSRINKSLRAWNC